MVKDRSRLIRTEDILSLPSQLKWSLLPSDVIDNILQSRNERQKTIINAQNKDKTMK